MRRGHDTPLTTLKALPPVAKHDDLPPPPPSPLRDTAPPPPPPHPKITLDTLLDTGEARVSASGSPIRGASLPQGVATPPESPSPGTSAMLGPPSPTASTAEASSRPKKVNPFKDLLETEKSYVDALSGIIRKVASAWSRSNLPPPELDLMFRAVETVFKANRSFYSKLKEIGPNPSSPRAIGDLLMKWIDQLDAPYTNYCSTYLSGFDAWVPVQSNQRLTLVLETFSASNPPPQSGPPCWTLDALFSLPRTRIRYYQKLYGRLLKSSAPGKSTDKKLIEAVGKLESLLTIVDERSSVILHSPSQVIETTDEVVIDTREKTEETLKPKVLRNEGEETLDGRAGSVETIRQQQERDVRSSVESSTRGSSLSSGQWSSRDTTMTSEGRSSVATFLSISMYDLERRLATDRCRDLFTMNLRNVRLSINSPNLPYTRELRLSEDTAVHFTPKSTDIGVIHRQGHIFLLTDLFLVCEHMIPSDRAHRESVHADMWLCYPPLAAKHLRVAPLDDNKLEITILKRESMILHFDSVAKRESVLKEFKSTTSLAATLPPPSKQAPPQLPSLNNLPRSSAGSTPLDRHPNVSVEESSSLRSANAGSRVPSPNSGDPSMHRMDPARNLFNSASAPRSRSPSIREGGLSGPPPYSPSSEAAAPSAQMRSPRPQPSTPASPGPSQFIPPPRGESSRPMPSPIGVGMTGLPQRPNLRDGPASLSPGQGFLPQRGESMPTLQPTNGMPPISSAMSSAMSTPPISGTNTPPRSVMSPLPMNGNAPQVGSIVGPLRNGPMGPGSGAFPVGLNPMHNQSPPYPGQANPQDIQSHPSPPFANPGRPSSDASFQGGPRKTPSLHSLGSQYDPNQLPPRSAPPIPNGFSPSRMTSFGDLAEGGSVLRPMLPSAALPRIVSSAAAFGMDDSPPISPVEEVSTGPVESSVLATMKCKVFLQQQHAQWKSLGSAKLTLYEQRPTMVKQLVVEADNKDKTMLISTIVLMDGVERVGKTGVAIELSDSGARTGIVYMIQLRNEKSAGGLFESLLAGSDRGSFK